MKSTAFLSTVAVLASLAAAPAFAGPPNGPNQTQHNSAPTTQDSTSTAKAKRGDASALGLNNNAIIQENDKLGRKGAHQSNSAPTTQSATSHAVSVGGDADALSANSNSVSQSNGAAK